MLLRAGRLPVGPGWLYEVKWDGFRALVSTEAGLRVRSRRGWNMTPLLPELHDLPAGLMLDGELVAFNEDGDPHFPLLVRRILHGDRTVAIQLMSFDALRVDGDDLMSVPFQERRQILERLNLDGPAWATPAVFDDGQALYEAVCERGLEGVVAKSKRGHYRPGERGWIKIKNPTYWRRDLELAAKSRRSSRLACKQPVDA
jgi:bifunctional non-homologous end joining protein LigD